MSIFLPDGLTQAIVFSVSLICNLVLSLFCPRGDILLVMADMTPQLLWRGLMVILIIWSEEMNKWNIFFQSIQTPNHPSGAEGFCCCCHKLTIMSQLHNLPIRQISKRNKSFFKEAPHLWNKIFSTNTKAFLSVYHLFSYPRSHHHKVVSYTSYIWKSIGQLQNTNTNVTGQWLNWIARRLFTKIVVWIFPEWIIASAVWALSCHNGPCSKCICVCVWLHWTRGKWHRVFRRYGRTKKQEILCYTQVWPAYASQPPIPCHVPIQIIPQHKSPVPGPGPFTCRASVNYQPYLGFGFHKWLNDETGFILLAAKSEGFILWQGLPLRGTK